MIIESLLDTDLYKLTMQQVILHQFPGVDAEFEFICRGSCPDLRPLAETIQAEVDHLCTLRVSEEEQAYLRGLPFIKADYVEFLKLFQLDQKFVEINDTGSKLAIRVKGPWLHVILFEVPVLAIVSESYYRANGPAPAAVEEEGLRRLRAKLEVARGEKNFQFIDFGTRRRFSRAWHEKLLRTTLAEAPEILGGTSNVMYARQFEIPPVGTMAHEFLQAGQALVHPRESQKYMLEAWVREYRGQLGIALTDTITMEAFLADFDPYFMRVYDGCRQDSGNPEAWTEKLLAHYAKHEIDPSTKTAVYSDGLTIERALQLHEKYNERIKTAFGIGTNYTNDVGVERLDIVIKMVGCNGQPVAKISDTPGKHVTGEDAYMDSLKRTFGVS